MKKTKVKNLEVDLLLEAIIKQYRYDFSAYNRKSFIRRLDNYLNRKKLVHISQIIPLILHNKNEFWNFVNHISVTVTKMFRDPFVYKMIRQKIIPALKVYKNINIWHAGCATGDEVYSMAILLKEEGLDDKVNIYATDINQKSLEIAKSGIYPNDSIKVSTLNYQKSGGLNPFSNYYNSEYNNSIMNSSLKENITFVRHNLAVDKLFDKMHFIICRNVLIYFDKSLQNSVVDLFYNSLITDGFLCIGTQESLMFSNVQDQFEVVGEKEKIFKKKG